MRIEKKIVLFGVVVSVVSIAISLGLSSFFLQKKVAYVRSQDLIYRYEGTLEAMAKFNNQKQQWQANVDTLKFDFQRAVNRYNQEYKKLAVSERQRWEDDLSSQERQLQSYASAIEGKIKQADEEMMQAALDQINVFVEQYSIEHGYDIILGTTVSGNVLYGKEDLDITEELLKELNKHYRGE